MLTLLHISDLHFGPPYLPRVGAALLKSASSLGADVIVISGDLTQRAKRHQFAAAKQFLDELPDVPKLVVPGNHDVPLYRVVERIVGPHTLYRQMISEELNQVWQGETATIVALDSSAPHTAITNGRIRPRQLDFCRQAFNQGNPDAARVVVAHHPLAPAPDYERDHTLPRAKWILRQLMEMKVDLVLGGHLHRAYLGNSLDRVPNTPRDQQGILLVQCGTTTSRRGRARERDCNSFNMITIEKQQVVVIRYMYFGEADAFRLTSRHEFRRPDRPGTSWR